MLAAQKSVRNNMRTYLETMNVPTREDIARLGELVVGLEEKIDQIADRFDAIEAVVRTPGPQIQRGRRARPGPQAARVPPAEPGPADRPGRRAAGAKGTAGAKGAAGPKGAGRTPGIRRERHAGSPVEAIAGRHPGQG